MRHPPHTETMKIAPFYALANRIALFSEQSAEDAETTKEDAQMMWTFTDSFENSASSAISAVYLLWRFEQCCGFDLDDFHFGAGGFVDGAVDAEQVKDQRTDQGTERDAKGSTRGVQRHRHVATAGRQGMPDRDRAKWMEEARAEARDAGREHEGEEGGREAEDREPGRAPEHRAADEPRPDAIGDHPEERL